MTSSLPAILSALRVSLHVSFALLLGIGLATSSPTLVTVILVVVLAGIYLAGTVAERRHWLDPGSTPGIGWAWLAAIFALWTTLVTVSEQFVWLLFPIAFLCQILLPRWPGLGAVVGAWLVAVLVPAGAVSVAGVVGPAVGTAVAVAIYRFYRALHNEARRQYAVAAELRATQERLGASERAAGRLAERERLSREIHDTLAQGLGSIVLLARAATKSAADQPGVVARLKAIEQVAAEDLAEARAFVSDLRSPGLADTVAESLAALVESRRTQLAALGRGTRLELRVDARYPDPEDGLVLLRVAQEAVSNALRHSPARVIVITYTTWPDRAGVDVVDDGGGIGEHLPGQGLTGLRERVQAANGSLNIESTAEGTAVAAIVPTRRERP